ncbi:hypothetical protein [Williamsia sterculiae]|uniref:Uncharacterized protein n=1 Tax=Williamsia sterculiae TaxID=1344003 RepID=A0A1N7FV12_9NOCA|nr:hypothetical protein [Williamsia sterculiae]SIS04127.1 hypothetical protein SAMN05445060_2306 [Williamsia sterculiae]
MWTRNTSSALVSAVVLAVGASLLLAPSASARPVTPDPVQLPNGVSSPGNRTEHPLTPPFSPVQVPRPIVTGGDGVSRVVVYRAYPFLAPWLHTAIGRNPWEVQGAARLTFVDPIGGRTVVVNPNGHCDFTDGRSVGPGTPLRPIVVDTGGFAVTIEPRLHRPG